jgi:hypothetical protein
MLKTQRAMTIDLIKAQARARAIVIAINCHGAPRPTFTWASQNLAAIAALLDTLHAPSADRSG